MNQRWNIFLFLALLLSHAILLSANSEARGNKVETFVLHALAPIAHASSTTTQYAFGIFGSFRFARSLREENRDLKAELEALRHQLAELHGVEVELERLARLSSYARLENVDSFIADVVYIDQKSWLRTLVLYAGDDRPKRNQPVVTTEGLVGRVIVPAGSYAKTLLITDRSSSVSAMIQRTRRRGILRGRGSDAPLLDSIPLQEDVVRGDRVVTAGIDGVFPRGIPIGVVERVDRGHELFHRVYVKPHVDFSVLDQVFVLSKEVIPAEVQEKLFAEDSP